ncbi:MAG TPA: hypothetical protein VMC09_01205 [Anaerolineales bacterium]|nr:hypothetical protein [Anaerolineales bacterium]
MNPKRLTLLTLGLLAVCLLAACGGLKAGEVRGALVDAAGQPSGSEYQVILARADTGAGTVTTTQYQTSTTNGIFVLEGVPAGSYAVFVLSMSGQGNFLQKDGKTLVFDLAEGKGFDLGKVTVK